MRQSLKDIVGVLAGVVPFPEPIVELGAFQVESQIGFADLRPFFPDKAYVGCDMRAGPGVDRIENMHRLTFADGSVGSILCLDTLEHVANCQLAVTEMHRVLAPGGVLVLASVMDFEIHEFPSDYWRFTPKAIEMLMRRFQTLQVFYQGNPAKPHTVLGIGRKSPEPFPAAISGRLATIEPEPVVSVALGLEEDALAEDMRDAALTSELATARAALARAENDLGALRDSRTWRFAMALRDLPLVRPSIAVIRHLARTVRAQRSRLP